MPASESMPRPHSLAHGQDGQCLCGMRHMIGQPFYLVGNAIGQLEGAHNPVVAAIQWRAAVRNAGLLRL